MDLSHPLKSSELQKVCFEYLLLEACILLTLESWWSMFLISPLFLFVGYNSTPGLLQLYLAERIAAHSLRCLSGRKNDSANVNVSPVVPECSSLHGKILEGLIFQQMFSWPFRNFPAFPLSLLAMNKARIISCEVSEGFSGQNFEVIFTHKSIPTHFTWHGLPHMRGASSPRPASFYSLLFADATSVNNITLIPL